MRCGLITLCRLSQVLMVSHVSPCPALGSQVDHAARVYNCIDKVDFAASGVYDSGTSQGLSPRGSIAVLRELLRLGVPDFDELTVGDLAKLQCAVTKSGHYVWASHQEIMAMGERLTPCDPIRDPQPSDSNGDDDDNPPAQNPDTEVTQKTTDREPELGRLQLVIDTVAGLPAWDWRRAYCQWRIFHVDHKVPVATGATSQHFDESTPPSWRDLTFTVTSKDLDTPDKLRKCRLEVEIKRPSRMLGRTKCVVCSGIYFGWAGDADWF